jgi:conjugal transfer pilus assembly protein TraW
MIYDDGKVIKSVKGDRNISFLIEKINEKGDNNKGIWGMLYPVKEESVVNYFRSKLAEVLKRYEEQGKNINLEKLYTLDKYTGMFPNAKEERKRCFDPSIELSKNIYDIKGNLLFEAGTVVNPLDFVNIGKYIVINGNDDKQLEYAMKGDYDLIMITEGNVKKIADKYNKVVYFVNDLIIKRLKIEKVPSVIIQEGRSVCVEEKVI